MSNSSLLQITISKIKKFQKSMNKFTYFGFIGVVIIFIFLLSIIPSVVGNLKHFYYFNFNPKAQVSVYEKEYKNIFDESQKVFNQSNQAITDLQSGKDTFYNVEQQLLVNFNKRDSDCNQLIKIDNSALALNLPYEFKEFYRERLSADKKDYQAFTVYRKGIEEYLTASDALRSYDENYNDFFKQFGKLDQSKYSQDQVDIVQYHVKLLESSYRNIAGLADTTDIFNQEILDYIQNEYNLFTYTQGFLNAFENKDNNKMQEAFQSMMAYAYNNPSADINNIISRWGVEKLAPYYEAQDKLHNTATDLYQKAYDYARKQKLKEILQIWNSETPGYIQNSNINII